MSSKPPADAPRDLASAHEATAQQLAASVEELFRGGERARRLVVRAGPVWQVLSTRREAKGKGLRHAATKSSRLPDSHKLDATRAMGMRELGFEKVGGHADWFRDLERAHVGAALELARELVYVARGLYRASEQLALDLEIDDREHPENPELLEAMRKIAKPGFAEADRHAMYNAMANATFLVAVDPAATAATDPEDALLRVGELRAQPVFAAFTDFDALRAFAPLEREYLPFHGSELFALLEEKGAASVLINPEGSVGGELYRHEIAALAEGVRRFFRKRSN